MLLDWKPPLHTITNALARVYFGPHRTLPVKDAQPSELIIVRVSIAVYQFTLPRFEHDVYGNGKNYLSDDFLFCV